MRAYAAGRRRRMAHTPRLARSAPMPIILHSDKVGMGADDRNTRKVGSLSPPKLAVTKASMKTPVVPLYRSTWPLPALAT
jgi:hypothetical protein